MKKVSVLVILAVFVFSTVCAFAGGIDAPSQCSTSEAKRSSTLEDAVGSVGSAVAGTVTNFSGSFQKAADSVKSQQDTSSLSLRENKSELKKRRSPVPVL